MKKTILFLIVCLFSAATVLSENSNIITSTINSESSALSASQISNQCNEELATTNLSDSVKLDSAKVQAVTSPANQIVLEKGRYKLNGKSLKKKDFKMLFNNDAESAKEYRKARAQITYEIITLIGVEVVLIATTGYYIGAIPCVLIAIPFGIAYEKHLKEAVRLYNLKHGSDIVGNIPKSENKIIAPEVKKVNATSSNQLNVGDMVSFYSFQTNSTVKGTIIEIKGKTAVVEYNSFDKKYTSEQQIYDVKKVK